MNSHENLKVTGRLNITVTDQNGAVKDQREVNNLVVSEGITFIASRMAGTSKAVMSHMQIGSGTGAAAAGDTENTFITTGVTGTTRKGLTVAGGTPGASSIVYSAQFIAGEGTGPITEAGIMNAASGACDLLCRTKFDVINKGANDTMTINWTINLTPV